MTSSGSAELLPGLNLRISAAGAADVPHKQTRKRMSKGASMTNLGRLDQGPASQQPLAATGELCNDSSSTYNNQITVFQSFLHASPRVLQFFGGGGIKRKFELCSC